MNSVFRRRGCLVALPAVLLAVLAFRVGPAQAASGVPYTDPNAVGSIGFCNAAGQSVTTGSINDVPFVTKAIDSTPAAAPYNGAGATAGLFIYQPRENVEPTNWNGEEVGATSKSSSPLHPTATLTAGDGALALALADYPPKWDGLMQLRIYLGAPDEPAYTAKYDATDIKIKGDSWQVVQGASVACGDGQSVSLEQVLASSYPQLTASPSAAGGTGATSTQGGKSSGATAKPGTGTAGAGAGGSAGGVGAANTAGSAGASPGVDGSAPGQDGSSSNPSGIANAASTGSSGSGGGPGAVVWILIVVGIVGVGAAGVLWQRSKPVGTRRR
jgi:hypothetical protein